MSIAADRLTAAEEEILILQEDLEVCAKQYLNQCATLRKVATWLVRSGALDYANEPVPDELLEFMPKAGT
jgi:hypothetical protein